MNGRIYDPNLGRFMTADPHIQAPGYSQSYNRYSYIMNNPLGGTDPSGFGWFSDFFHSVNTFLQNPFKIENAYSVLHNQPGGAHVDRFMMGHEWARVIGHAAANFWAGYACGWGCASSAESFLTGYEVYLSGGSHGDIQRATLISFGTSAATYGVGSAAPYAETPVGNVLGHALVGCASASASGGNCGQGALGAGFGAVASGIGGQAGLSKFENGVFTTIVGGVASRLGGGSFYKGAQSAALGYLMNSVMHDEGVYNARDDRYVGPGKPDEVLYSTGNAPRVRWTGEYIDSLEVSVSLNDLVPDKRAQLAPDVAVVIKMETGYNEYEFRVALQNYQITVTGGQVISRIPTSQEMTNRYVWRGDKADMTVHLRRVWGLCISSLCTH